jgi:acyl-CoA thioester hydrolase
MAGIFTWPVRVYWEDTDAGGIVFYANYLKFFERARTEWLRSLGVQQSTLKAETGGMFVVTGTELRYHRPAVLDDCLQISAEVKELGRASMTLYQRAVRQTATRDGTDELLCEGTIRIGWVEAERMRPGRIPQSIWEVLT